MGGGGEGGGAGGAAQFVRGNYKSFKGTISLFYRVRVSRAHTCGTTRQGKRHHHTLKKRSFKYYQRTLRSQEDEERKSYTTTAVSILYPGTTAVC